MAPSFHRSALDAVYAQLDALGSRGGAVHRSDTESSAMAHPAAWLPATVHLAALDRRWHEATRRDAATMVQIGRRLVGAHAPSMFRQLRARTPCYAVHAFERMLNVFANYGDVVLERHQLFAASLHVQMYPATSALWYLLEGAALEALDQVGADCPTARHEVTPGGARFELRWE